MEYRYSPGRRVIDALIGSVLLLVTAFLIVRAILVMAGPSANHSHGVARAVVAVILGLLVWAAPGCIGLFLIRRAIGDRLAVTDVGLVSREARLISVRATTIPWSSVKCFTVLGAGSRSSAVYAILNSGQQVKLSCTERWQWDAAAVIAEKLTTKLREYCPSGTTSTRPRSVTD
jgi:hypothetical protein